MDKEKSELPFVSVCTPTFNRRPFIPYIIKCFDRVFFNSITSNYYIILCI